MPEPKTLQLTEEARNAIMRGSDWPALPGEFQRGCAHGRDVCLKFLADVIRCGVPAIDAVESLARLTYNLDPIRPPRREDAAIHR